MPHIARLTPDGVIVAVEECHADDHKTCPRARTVALDDGHDMRGRCHAYRWDFNHQCFLPLSAEPLDAADRDTPELVEGLVQAVEDVFNALCREPSRRTARALAAYRRHTPRPRDPADPASLAGGEDEAPAVILETEETAR